MELGLYIYRQLGRVRRRRQRRLALVGQLNALYNMHITHTRRCLSTWLGIVKIKFDTDHAILYTMVCLLPSLLPLSASASACCLCRLCLAFAQDYACLRLCSCLCLCFSLCLCLCLCYICCMCFCRNGKTSVFTFSHLHLCLYTGTCIFEPDPTLH